MKPTVSGAAPTVTVGPPVADSADEAAATIVTVAPAGFSALDMAVVTMDSVRWLGPVVLVLILQALSQVIFVTVVMSTLPQRTHRTRQAFPNVQFRSVSKSSVAVAQTSMSKWDGKVPTLYRSW